MRKFLTLLLGCSAALAAKSQDLHFTRVQDLQSWYNQSLQTDRHATGSLNYRTLNYQGIIAFRTATLLADVPLVGKEAREESKGGYVTLSGGGSVDKSNSQVLRNTNAMLGIAYSVPVNAAQTTYVSAGFQGSFFQSRTNTADATFPDQYDSYRLVPNLATNDPYQSSSVNYTSLNAGLSLFHRSASIWWHGGASVRHFNEPQAGNKSSGDYRLPRTIGAQAGFGKQLTADQRINLYAALNWKANATEHLAGLAYNLEFDGTGFDRGIGVALAYRFQDALIPGFEFRMGHTVFGFNYDLSMGAMHQTGMRRQSLELNIKHKFN